MEFRKSISGSGCSEDVTTLMAIGDGTFHWQYVIFSRGNNISRRLHDDCNVEGKAIAMGGGDKDTNMADVREWNKSKDGCTHCFFIINDGNLKNNNNKNTSYFQPN